MPSLGDVANDVLARLDVIKSNTDTIKTNTTSIKNDVGAIQNNTAATVVELNQLDTDVKSGFTNLAQGVQVLVNLGMQQNQLLEENNKQNETIICWLTNIANTLCDVKHNTDQEVMLQTDISHTLHHLDDIAELVNAKEAVEVSNRYAIEKRIDECCPPKHEPPKPCFEKCEAPRHVPFEPVKTDWKPVEYRNPDAPK
jgi:hypothetical protein